MKALKKIALAAMVTASLGAVSSTAFAESDPGRIVYSPTSAIEMTAGKVQVAIDALTAGTEAETLSKLIKDASDATKEINASDSVFRASTKANNMIKSARNHVKEGATQQAEQELRSAHQAILDLKKIL
jgi:molecular chaperone DnaK (HSP70)